MLDKAQILEWLVAAGVLAVVVPLLWRIAEALRRRGIVVRPVSGMDHKMTEIEKRHVLAKSAQGSVPQDQA